MICCIFREECVCNGVRYFAILSMQRSGSGWFETLLNSHINVSSNGEIFTVGNRRNNISSIMRTMDKVYNLDWFTSASKNECLAAVGFKWMLNQVSKFIWRMYSIVYAILLSIGRACCQASLIYPCPANGNHTFPFFCQSYNCDTGKKGEGSGTIKKWHW